MQYISFEKNNLCEVEPELLTAAVVRRTSADLRWANLSSQQVKPFQIIFLTYKGLCHCFGSQISSILTGCADRNTLQELQLGMVGAEVEDSLLARARAAIPQLEVQLTGDWFSDSE